MTDAQHKLPDDWQPRVSRMPEGWVVEGDTHAFCECVCNACDGQTDWEGLCPECDTVADKSATEARSIRLVSERDELAELIYATMDDTDGYWAEWADRIAGALIAAGWTSPRDERMEKILDAMGAYDDE